MMKIISICTVFVMSILIVDSATAQSQFQDPRSVSFGVKGGPISSTLTGSEGEEVESSMGVYLGTFMNFSIWEELISNMEMRVEVNYSNRGYTIIGRQLNDVIYANLDLFTDEELHGYHYTGNDIFDEDIQSSFRSSFIEVPLLLRYSVPLDRISLFAVAGPSFQFIIKSTMENEFQLTTEEGETYVQKDINDFWKTYWKNANMSVLGGLGVVLPFGVVAEVRYDLGLGSALVNYPYALSQKGIMANVGIQF